MIPYLRITCSLLLTLALRDAIADSCAPEQQEYFLCKRKTETAVICGSGREEMGQLALEYRFVKKGKTELSYPVRKELKGNFLASGAMGAHGSILHVSFIIGPYKYILEERSDMQSPSEGAIYVLRNGKMIRHLECEEYSTQAMDPLFKKEVLPKEEFQDFRFR